MLQCYAQLARVPEVFVKVACLGGLATFDLFSKKKANFRVSFLDTLVEN